jgi:hypothetical protein
MNVRKFRSAADMPGSQPLKPLDPNNLEIACELTELARTLPPWKLEPGVRKFRSAEEMWAYQQEREKQQVRKGQ